MTDYEVKPWTGSMVLTGSSQALASILRWHNMHRRLRACFPLAAPYEPISPVDAVALLKSKGRMMRGGTP